MRVLTVIDAFRLGGAETLVAQLGRVAADVGLELDVLSLHGRSPELSRLEPLLLRAGIEPRYLGARRTLDPRGFARLVRYIRRTDPDVVHAHLEMSMTMALPAAALAGKPGVGTFHQVYRPMHGRELGRERLAVEVASRSQATVFVSNASRHSYTEHFRSGGTPRSWRVVHNGVDLELFTPAPRGGRLAVPQDLGLREGPVVTVVAALRDFKGITHAISAWPQVLRRHEDATLLVVGSGEQGEQLHHQVAELGLGGSVVFAGMRSDVVEIMRGSDVVLLPSIFGENLPTVLMEAGGCGRPVVASDVGGIADIVVDGETGLLTRPADPRSIAAAIVRLLDDESLRERLGRAARARMEQHFDARTWAANLLSLYREVGQRDGRGWRRRAAASFDRRRPAS